MQRSRHYYVGIYTLAVGTSKLCITVPHEVYEICSRGDHTFLKSFQR